MPHHLQARPTRRRGVGQGGVRKCEPMRQPRYWNRGINTRSEGTEGSGKGVYGG